MAIRSDSARGVLRSRSPHSTSVGARTAPSRSSTRAPKQARAVAAYASASMPAIADRTTSAPGGSGETVKVSAT